jgi:periplasmic protein TonB
MNDAAQFAGSPWLDDNRRLAWIAPLAVVLWLGLLAVFAHLLSQTAPPPSSLNAVEARIIELPAPAGLQSSPPAAHAKAAPQPAVHHAVRRMTPHHVPVHPRAPVVPASAEGTAKSAPSAAPTTSAPASTASPAAAEGSAGGVGLGNDNSGARAIYDPAPEIPDELREDALDAVAVAHFEVGYDGHAEVTLTQPTMNPQLNELLLATLRQWRFAPATRNGVAVESAFDIRIPVTIQ